MANGQDKMGLTLDELRARIDSSAKENQERQGMSLDELRTEIGNRSRFTAQPQAADTSSTQVQTPLMPSDEVEETPPVSIRQSPLGGPMALPFSPDSRMINAYDNFVKGTQDAIQRGIKSVSLATFDLTNFVRKTVGKPEIESARDLPTFQFAKKLEEEVDVAFPGAPELQNDFLSAQLPRMAGEMANQVLVGASLGWSGVAVMGATYASDEYENAIQSGSSEDEAFNTWLMNVPVGGLEAVPVAAFFSRFNKLTNGSVSKVLVGGFTGAGEELIQEGADTWVRNLIAKNTYDETRKLTDGLLEQASLGGGIGFALNAVGLSLKGRALSDKNLTPTDRASFIHASDRASEGAKEALNILDQTGTRGEGTRVGRSRIRPTDERLQQEGSKGEGSRVGRSISRQEYYAERRKEQGIDQWLTSKENEPIPQIQNFVSRAEQLRQKKLEGFSQFEGRLVLPENTKEADTPGSIENGDPLVLNGEKKNSSDNSFKRWFRRWFSSGGLFPDEVFNEKVYRDGRVAAEVEKVRFNVRDLNQKLIEHYGASGKKGAWGFLSGRDIPKKVFDDIDKVLRGQEPANALHPEIRDIVDGMRDHIDSLSHRFIHKGIISGKMEAKFKENIGIYIHRQYDVHKYGADWAKKMKKENPEIVLRAEQFLIDSYKKQNGGARPPQQVIRNAIDDILVGQYKGNLIYSNRQQFEKDFDLGPIMKRQDIAPEIRALMGEVKDPIVNYVDTVTKMSEILETRQMYQNWRNRFKGQYLFDESDTRPEGFNFSIEAGNDPVFQPIDGMRTNQDIYEAMQKMNQPENLAPWIQTALKANSVAKYSKVILSHTTQVRNVIGGTKYMIRNGMFPKGNDFRTGFESVKEVFSNPQSEASRAKLTEYSELGLRGKSPIGKEISEAIKDFEGDSFDVVDLSRSLVDKGFKNPGRAAKVVAKKASALYKAGDDMLRIAFFEAEYRRLQKAVPDITRQEVADRILDYYQNYDALPEVVQKLRRVPFIAPFLAHTSEVIRTGYNTAWYAKQEIQSGNPELRKIGYQRMVGLGTSAIMATTAAMAMKNILGIDEDMDEDIRRFAAPWDANSTLLPLSYEDGETRFINLSYIDVDEAVIDPIMTLFGRGADVDDTWIDQTGNALAQLVQPVLQEEIFAKSLIEFRANQKESGAQIYNPQDKPGNIAQDIFLHFWSAFEPGSLSSVSRAFERVQDEESPGNPGDELIGLMGMRITALDINRSLGFNTRDYRDKVREARRIYNRVRYQKDATDEEKLEALARSNDAYREQFNTMRETYRAARRLGVDEASILETFEDSGLSKNEIKNIRLGRFEPFEPAEDE